MFSSTSLNSLSVFEAVRDMHIHVATNGQPHTHTIPCKENYPHNLLHHTLLYLQQQDASVQVCKCRASLFITKPNALVPS